MKNRILAIIVIATAIITSCSNSDGDYTPKPPAFYRITMPEKDYKLYDTNILPFTFEYPEYSNIKVKRNDKDIKYFDIIFPQFNGTVFVSYKQLGGKRTVASEVDTAHQLVSIHYNMASGVHEQSYSDDINRIYANTYTLKGKSIASTYQFWATDSTNHFIRGAFYVNSNPNYDSLQPVYEFIQKDIVHFIETLKWK
ncbi:MAG: hypothetical protein IKJ67_07090 [Bacteroidales bacterium]|nr:hypothetical protein [Bacteroidales bacterium]